MTRKELQDRQAKYDAAVSNVGQTEAKRYLAAKADHSERLETAKEVVACLAFAVAMGLLLVLTLSL